MNKVVSGVVGIAAIAAVVFIGTGADYVTVESPIGKVDIGNNDKPDDSTIIYNININQLDDLNVEQLKDLEDKISTEESYEESEKITAHIKNAISEKESSTTPKQNFQTLKNINGEIWNYSGVANFAIDNGQITFYDDGTFAMEGVFDGSPYSNSGEFYIDFNSGVFVISTIQTGPMTYYITSTGQGVFSISNPLFNTYYDFKIS